VGFLGWSSYFFFVVGVVVRGGFFLKKVDGYSLHNPPCASYLGKKKC